MYLRIDTIKKNGGPSRGAAFTNQPKSNNNKNMKLYFINHQLFTKRMLSKY